MRRVAVVGAGCTKVGEHWDRSLRSLFFEASLKALSDANYKVDALYVGNMASSVFQEQEHLGPMMAEAIGMSGVAACKVEAACASGGMAMHQGFLAVASGLYDHVLVGGVEKMSDALTPEVTYAMMMAEDREYVGYTGVSFVGLNALIHRLYMDRFKAKPEDIASFAVQCHENASLNPYAQYQWKTSVERVLSSPLIADPIHRDECSGIGDGASVVALCPLEEARKISDIIVEVAASSVATDFLSLHERDDLLTFNATRLASEKAYKIAKLTPKDVSLIELHDAFTILAPISLEDLGFAKKGEGYKLIAEGQVAINSDIPCNCFGGLKARGHPIGATGVYQIAEILWQLRAEAGKNQVDGAEIGLAQSIGGIGSTVVINILRRVK